MTRSQPELCLYLAGADPYGYLKKQLLNLGIVRHRVGEGDDIVAQLAVGEAAFWVAPPSEEMKRLSHRAIDGATSRTLLVVDDPDRVLRQAVAAGAAELSPVSDEHGWRLGRIVDPFGQEWEIGVPLGPWPPR